MFFPSEVRLIQAGFSAEASPESTSSPAPPGPAGWRGAAAARADHRFRPGIRPGPDPKKGMTTTRLPPWWNTVPGARSPPCSCAEMTAGPSPFQGITLNLIYEESCLLSSWTLAPVGGCVDEPRPASRATGN